MVLDTNLRHRQHFVDCKQEWRCREDLAYDSLTRLLIIRLSVVTDISPIIGLLAAFILNIRLVHGDVQSSKDTLER